MRIIALLLCLITPTIFADPCSGAYFIRGDVNCDGALNNTDLVIVGNAISGESPQPSRYDAADLDDNGSVNTTDLVILSDFLYDGGSAPHCPYPNSGLDCSLDDLDECLSRPEFATEDVATIEDEAYSLSLIEDGDLDWFYPFYDENSPPKYFIPASYVIYHTDGSITVYTEHDVTCDDTVYNKNTYDVHFRPTNFDDVGFTTERLDSEVQELDIKFDVDVRFALSSLCDCDTSSNIFEVDLSGSIVSMKFKNENGELQTVNSTLSWNTNRLTLTANVTNPGCVVNFSGQGIQDTSGEGNALKTDIVNGLGVSCEEWQLVEWSLEALRVIYDPTNGGYQQGDDMFEIDSVRFKASSLVQYSWCDEC